PAPTALYTLSLHDALPILTRQGQFAIPIRFERSGYQTVIGIDPLVAAFGQPSFITGALDLHVAKTIRLRLLRLDLLVHFQRQLRSEEHTSELQSRENLVCR